MIRLLGLVFGPIFIKEMLEISRRKRYYFNRVVYGLGLLYAAFLAWSELTANAQYGGIRVMAQLGSVLFVSVSVIQFAAVFFLVPIFLCNTIAAERTGGTLELLFTTDLTDRQIVLGKVSSRIAVMMFLLLSGLPVLSIIMLFGGIDPRMLWHVEWGSLLFCVMVGSASIYYATRCQTPIRAVFATYATVLVIGIGVALYAFFFVGMTSFFVTLAPLEWLPLCFLVLTALFSIQFVRGATLWLRFPTLDVGRLLAYDKLPYRKLLRQGRKDAATAPEPSADAQAEPSDRRLSRFRSLWGPLQIGVVDYEPRLRDHLWIFVLLGIVLLINVHTIRQYEADTLGIVLLPIWGGVFLFTAIVSVSNPLLGRRPGFFDLLLSTLLEPHEILTGAVMVNLPLLLRILTVPLVFSVLWITSNPLGIASALVTGTLFGLLIIGLGNLCSLADHRPMSRVVPILLLPLGVWIGPWLMPETLVELTAPAIWVAAVAMAVLTRLIVRSSRTCLAITLHVMAMYFVATATFAVLPAWLFEIPRADRVTAIDPFFWLYDCVRPNGWYFAPQTALNVLPAYWLALAACLVWMWRWTIAHFDWLAGRCDTATVFQPEPALTGSLAPSLT